MQFCFVMPEQPFETGFSSLVLVCFPSALLNWNYTFKLIILVENTTPEESAAESTTPEPPNTTTEPESTSTIAPTNTGKIKFLIVV